MTNFFTSRPFIGTALFGLGFLVAGLTLRPDSRQITNDNPSHSQKGMRSDPSILSLRSNHSLGTSESERRRVELAENWENANMALIIEKMDSIKTFESNTYDTGLSQELCDYLAISRSESTTIDRAIRATMKQLQKFQISSIETTQVDENTSKFVIKKFSNEGAHLKESLQETLRETLGENRSFLFNKISRRSLDYSFLNFGENDVHITMKTSGPPEVQRYETQILSGTGSRLFRTKGVPTNLAHLLQVE